MAVALCGCGATRAVQPPSQPPRPAPPPLRLEAQVPALSGGAQPAPVLLAMQKEIARYGERFTTLPPPRPYFLAFQVTDRHAVDIAASLGALTKSERSDRRHLDVDVRVGDYTLDNTHFIRGEPWRSYFSRGQSAYLMPLEREASTLRPTLWWAAQRTYEDAVESYLRVQGNRAVKTRPEDPSDDFSRETKTTYLEPTALPLLAMPEWEQRVRSYSALFRGHAGLLDSGVSLHATVANRYLASTEGTVVQTSRTYVRITFHGRARTDDGMDVSRQEHIDMSEVGRAPDDADVRRRVQRVNQLCSSRSTQTVPRPTGTRSTQARAP